MSGTRWNLAALAAVVVLTAAASRVGADEPTAIGAMYPNSVREDGSVVWVRREARVAPEIAAARAALVRSRSAADSMAAWKALSAEPLIQPLALGAMARLWLAQSDTAAADSAWGQLSRTPGLWQWEALRQRVDLRMGRPDQALALLEQVEPEGWTEIEESTWLLRRARLHAALGDTVGAESLARRVIHRHAGTSVAVRAVQDLELWWHAHGTPWPLEDALAAAEVEARAGERASAVRRLERLEPRLDPESKWSAGLRRAGLEREMRRYPAALATLSKLDRQVVDEHRKVAIELERARVHRDAGSTDRALKAYDRVASQSGDQALAEIADAEALRTAQLAGRDPQALAAAERLAHRGGPGASAGAVRAGIVHLTRGDLDSARTWFERADGEEAMFWRSVVADNSGADSLRTLLARAPGFGFYRFAARESLQAFDWPRTIAAPAERPPTAIHQAARLVALGAHEDALRVLERWRAGEVDRSREAPAAPRAHGAPEPVDLLQVPSWSGQLPELPEAKEPRWRQLLSAASVSFAAGKWATGIRYAWLAYGAAPESDTLARWSVVPWLYPPAHGGLFAPEGVWNDSTALLYAVTWQESRFDSVARSSSNALGLMQLKLATAREQARSMRLPRPHERDLFRPTLNVQLGAGYLHRIARGFDGRTTMALAAYNAGPTGARSWARLPDPGGEALACELITYGQTHHYVKTVLGTWQAARALRPRLE